MVIESRNPANGELMKAFEPISESEIEAKLRLAVSTFQTHRLSSFAERAEKMLRAAEILEIEKEKFGRIMSTEMGKTLISAIGEAEKCAWVCRFYAENAEKFMADEHFATDAKSSFVRYLPIGAVLAVMPWNFPFWQVFRFAAPALMAGNVGLLKHASNVPQCALAIEEIFRRAGFVEGTFQTLLIGSAPVAKIIADERVKAVTLTGSEPAGSKVAAQAGSVIKKTILELGGSDPFIIMPGADLPKAIETAVKARTINNGQSCIAAKRFIVHEQIYDEFEAKFVEQMLALKVGNPLEKETEIGPLATEVLREDLDKQVRTAVSAGAKVLCGGKKIEGKGYFYEPTVLVNVSKDSPVFYEELFGPAAMLFRVKDIDEAIKLANDSPFGLGSSVWTRDEKEQEKFASEIEAGQTFINAMVASDPRLPFGGIKHSGYGRELSVQGIREFVNAKTIFIR